MNAELLALIEAANRAPSVHNIQPTRFRIDDERTITLLEDTSRRLFVGDPEGKDNQKSLGAALEGLMLALAARGLGGEIEKPSGAGDLRETMRVRIASGGVIDALEPFTHTRAELSRRLCEARRRFRPRSAREGRGSMSGSLHHRRR
jgi:hypothetical protein